jgi:phosphate starvation-inducible protein PhoH
MRRPLDRDDDNEGRRRSHRKAKRHHQPEERQVSLHPNRISPANENQRKAYNYWDEGQHLLLHGCAGTGKTLIAMYLGLSEVMAGRHTKVVLVRSAVPTRDQGFLPGNLKEKAAIYELPFVGACADIYERGDAYGQLKSKGLVEFVTTSYVRGITLHDCIIIIDEVQNLSMHEIASVVTRTGQNSRLIVLGDFMQSDLQRHHERKGVTDFIKIAKRMGSFGLVEFTHSDILRSDVVKEFIVARDELGIID